MRKWIGVVVVAVLAAVAIAGDLLQIGPDESAKDFAGKADWLASQIQEQESGWERHETRVRQKFVDQLRVTLAADEWVEEIKEADARQWMSEGKLLTFLYQKRFVGIYIPFRDWSQGTKGLGNVIVFAAGKEATTTEERKLVAMGPELFFRECNYGARAWLTKNMKYGGQWIAIDANIDAMVIQILGFSSLQAEEKKRQ